MCNACKLGSMKKKNSKLNIVGAVTNIGATAAGIVAGQVLANKALSSMNPVVSGGIRIAAGVLLPSLVKNDMVKNVGTGIAISGALALVNKFLPSVFTGTTPNAYLAGDYAYPNAAVSGIMNGIMNGNEIMAQA